MAVHRSGYPDQQRLIGHIAHDTRFALRGLARSPGFSISVIAVLALAVGGNTAIFSLVEATLLRPLPYPAADQLCMLWKSVPDRNLAWDWASLPMIRDWRDHTAAFQGIAAILRPEGSRVTWTGSAPFASTRIQAAKVERNFFEVAGTPALVGRTFSTSELSVVLSHAFWQQQFGASRDAIGKKLILDGRAFSIAGVMPPEFQIPDRHTQIWIPLDTDSRYAAFARMRVADAFSAIARLKNGVSTTAAQAELDALLPRLAGQYPATDARLAIRVVPLAEQVTPASQRRILLSLSAAVACVLLIACSNLAMLLFARGITRRREWSIRTALGATPGRLLGQALLENLLVSFLAGALALPVARAIAFAFESPFSWNPAVFAFTFTTCSVCGVGFGWLSASSFGRPSASLASRPPGLLVSLQFALTIVLLTGASLLVRELLRIDAMAPGFETEHLLAVTLEEGSPEETIRALEALPGVRAAAAGAPILTSFQDHVPNQTLLAEGNAPATGPERHGRSIVSPGYFRTMGIPILSGRAFSLDDRKGTVPVAVINRTMAARFWPGENAIGKRFKQVFPGLDSSWYTVVGVAADAVQNRDGAIVPLFYLPAAQWGTPPVQFVVRTIADPRVVIPEIRRTLPVSEITTVAQQMNILDQPRRFRANLMAAFAALGLLLSVLGLYGLTSFMVTRRTREIGIRMAVGATPANIVNHFARQGLRRAVAGLSVGLTATAIFIPADLPSYGTAIVILLLAALSAAIVPALRAARVNPAEHTGVY